MNQLAVVTNEKPRSLAGTKIQGMSYNGNGNSTTVRNLKESKTRYEKGLELYRAGAVTINPAGHGFKVLGFTVDTERVSCDCPEKKPCIHYYAASLFQKNGCKVKSAPNSTIEARGEAQVTPRVKVRLSALSLAVAILESHGKPITSKNLFKVAGELEEWALGK